MTYHTFSYTSDLDCGALENKSIGCRIPKRNEIRLTGKAGFEEIDILSACTVIYLKVPSV
jgi:hypothetical protein